MNKWYLTVGNKSKPKLLESYYTLTHDNYDVTFSDRELEPGGHLRSGPDLNPQNELIKVIV